MLKPSNINHNNWKAVENYNNLNNWNLENIDLITPYNQTNYINLSHHDILQIITTQTVSSYIKKAKSKPSSPSGITNTMLKEFPNKTIIHITRIFNAALLAGFFPTPFKNSNQFLIPKNYRLITLIEPISKIFEKIVNFRLKNYLEATNQFHKFQYGFRSGRYIQDVLSRLIF